MTHVTPHCVGADEGFIRWAAVCAVCERRIIYTAHSGIGAMDEMSREVCCSVNCATIFAETVLVELGG
jgi:hypothetical protein